MWPTKPLDFATRQMWIKLWVLLHLQPLGELDRVRKSLGPEKLEYFEGIFKRTQEGLRQELGYWT